MTQHITCKSCDSSISRTNKVCPFCDDNLRTQRIKEVLFKYMMFSLILIAAFVFAVHFGWADPFLNKLSSK